eukprot:scaffold32814_cov148-Skeletonema_menzelii.AAC.3
MERSGKKSWILLGHSLDESYYLTGMMACALTSSTIMSYNSTQITLSREGEIEGIRQLNATFTHKSDFHAGIMWERSGHVSRVQIFFAPAPSPLSAPDAAVGRRPYAFSK